MGPRHTRPHRVERFDRRSEQRVSAALSQTGAARPDCVPRGVARADQGLGEVWKTSIGWSPAGMNSNGLAGPKRAVTSPTRFGLPIRSSFSTGAPAARLIFRRSSQTIFGL